MKLKLSLLVASILLSIPSLHAAFADDPVVFYPNGRAAADGIDHFNLGFGEFGRELPGLESYAQALDTQSSSQLARARVQAWMSVQKSCGAGRARIVGEALLSAFPVTNWFLNRDVPETFMERAVGGGIATMGHILDYGLVGLFAGSKEQLDRGLQGAKDHMRIFAWGSTVAVKNHFLRDPGSPCKVAVMKLVLAADRAKFLSSRSSSQSVSSRQDKGVGSAVRDLERLETIQAADLQKQAAATAQAAEAL